MSVPLRTMAQLVVDAREKVRKALPLETYQSYPILLEPERGAPPLVAFFYGTQRATREGRYLVAPDLLVHLDARSGEVARKRAVTPADLRGPHKPGEIAGLQPGHKGWTAEDWDRLHARLFGLYDRAALRFLDGVDPVKYRSEAKELSDLFKDALEVPLLPYYHSLGKDFFTWLQRGADAA
jgi:hypothetical protein